MKPPKKNQTWEDQLKSGFSLWDWTMWYWYGFLMCCSERWWKFKNERKGK